VKHANLTLVTIRNADGGTGSFYMRDGGNPADYTSALVIKTESATFNFAKQSQEIAAHLPGQWEIAPAWNEDPESPFYLIRDDGLQLFLRLTDTYQYRGKGSASYSRPKDSRGRYVSIYDDGKTVLEPGIGFALTKTPEEIAKDITRRLIPEAERVHALALRAVESANAYVVQEAKSKELAQKHYNALHEWGLYVRDNGGSVRVEGYLSPEQFEKLLARLT
jgi:hypothetical protein